MILKLGGYYVRQKDKLPPKKELEQDLAELRKVSASIDHLTKVLVGKELPPEEIDCLIEEQVKRQTQIVDRFISLSNDVKELKHFTNIVSAIESKTEYLKSIEDAKEYAKAKEEILHLVDEWIFSLERIITGVMERAE